MLDASKDSEGNRPGRRPRRCEFYSFPGDSDVYVVQVEPTDQDGYTESKTGHPDHLLPLEAGGTSGIHSVF